MRIITLLLLYASSIVALPKSESIDISKQIAGVNELHMSHISPELKASELHKYHPTIHEHSIEEEEELLEEQQPQEPPVDPQSPQVEEETGEQEDETESPISPSNPSTPPTVSEIAWTERPDGQGAWIKQVSEVIQGMVNKKTFDLDTILQVGEKVMAQLKKLKKSPADIWKEVQNIVDYAVYYMNQKHIDYIKITQVRQVLWDSLSIVASKVAGIADLPQGCWMGQQFRLGTYPTECPNETKMSGPMCYKDCPSGGLGLGPFCFKGIRPSFRGWGQQPKCSTELYPSLGFCYKEKCSELYPKEMGPFCLSTTCPSFAPVKCGRLCLVNEVACTNTMKRIAVDGRDAIMAMQRNDTVDAYSNTADIARTLVNYRGCHMKNVIHL